MAPPQGIVIGGDGRDNKPLWKVGKLLGSGACASVHVLLDHNKETSFCAKLVPVPTKITKQKKTLPERNARLLHYEELVYRNQFPEYQGYILPKLPPFIGPPVSGEVQGFKFLVLEKMKGPLWDVVPSLLQHHNTNTIAIGPIAEQLFVCVETLQKKNHLVVDVKPENFMLAYLDCNRSVSFLTKHKNSPAEALARKIRLLDLGLVVPFRGPDGHRADDGIAELVGTPLYASLNVHASHTPSRRDDIEALGYVIAELIIRLVATAKGEHLKYESKGDMPSYLPWSHGDSDEAIGELKQQQVHNLNSEFYKRMGDKATAKRMKQFLDLAQQIKYKEAPDYDSLKEILGQLVVSIEMPALSPKKRAASSARAKKPAPAATATTTSGRALRSANRNQRRASTEDSDVEFETEPSPAKHQKTVDEEHFEDAQEPPQDMEVEVLVISDDSDDETCFHDTQEGEMDWEPTPKENHEPDQKKKARVGLEIVVENGPHAGESFQLIHGEINAVLIGKNPKATNKQFEAVFPLPNDREIDNTHARLDLKATKQVCSVKVSDLKSNSGIVIGTTNIAKGGNRQCFINDKFTVGQSTFRIATFSSKSASQKMPPKAKSGSKAKTVPLTKNTPAKARSKTAPTTADVRLVVTSGPYKGGSFELEKGNVEAINVGSMESAAKKGTSVVLPNDDGIETRHARFELVKSKIVKVNIVDLSKDAGILVNGLKMPSKKEKMCFIGDKVQIGSTVLELKNGA